MCFPSTLLHDGFFFLVKWYLIIVRGWDAVCLSRCHICSLHFNYAAIKSKHWRCSRLFINTASQKWADEIKNSVWIQPLYHRLYHRKYPTTQCGPFESKKITLMSGIAFCPVLRKVTSGNKPPLLPQWRKMCNSEGTGLFHILKTTIFLMAQHMTYRSETLLIF